MFGIICWIINIANWCKEEQEEQRSRALAKKYHNLTYMDKWGNTRYTATGKRKKFADYKMDLHRDINEIEERLKYEKNKIAKQEDEIIKKQKNEIKIFEEKYNNKKELYLGVYNLSFKEYFYATHKCSLLYKHDLFIPFTNIDENSIKKIAYFRVKCRIIQKDYI